MAFCNQNMNEIDRNECIGNSLPKINENFELLDNQICELSALYSFPQVSKIVAGSNITISPSSGTGIVTINSTATGGSTGNEVLSAVNIGTGPARIFKEKSGQNLQFRTLAAGNTNVQLLEDGDTIKIFASATTTGTGGEVNTSSNLGTGIGLAAPKVLTDLPFKSLVAGPGVNLSTNASTVTIASSAVNIGSGQGELVKPSTAGSQPIQIRRLVQGNNVTINTVGDTVTIAAAGGGGGGGITGAQNVGTGQGQVYQSATSGVLNFKTIRQGYGTFVTNNPNDVTISVDPSILGSGGGGGEVNTASSLGSFLDGASLVTAKNGVDLPFRRVKGGTGITVAEETNNILITAQNNGDITNGQNVGTGIGAFAGKSASNLQFKSIATTGTNITVSEASNTISINAPNVITNSQNATSVSGNEASIIPTTTKSGSNLLFKKITAGDGIGVFNGTNDVVISALSDLTFNSLTPNGYQKFSNGLLLQWGSTLNTVGGANTNHTVSFPTTFSSVFVVVIGTYTSSSTGDGAQRMAQLVSWTTTGFTWFSDRFETSGSNDIGIHWFAIGL